MKKIQEKLNCKMNMKNYKLCKSLTLFLFFSILCSFSFASEVLKTKHQNFSYEVISDKLFHPWGLEIIKPDTFLITSRGGELYLVNADGEMKILHKFDVYALGQGGLLDIKLSDNFKQDRLVYFTYAKKNNDKGATTLGSFTLSDDYQLEDIKDIYTTNFAIDSSYHFGSRIVVKGDYIYFSTGDRGEKKQAQNLDNELGSIIRVHKNGTLPQDNPFYTSHKKAQAIYSYGHRNIQGFLLTSKGDLLAHEHGPKGGDELNIIQAGNNYGWPVITYGKTYVLSLKIGEGTHKKGMQQPLHYWVPSIAPSGMVEYQNSKIKAWQSNLLVGSLKFQQLVRLKLDANLKIVEEERMFKQKFGRIRDIEVELNGNILIITDAAEGQLVRLIAL